MSIAVLLAIIAAADAAGNFSERVNGVLPAPDQYPFMVSVRGMTKNLLCGGSIIATQWIVTAAQCQNNETIKYIGAGNYIFNSQTLYDVQKTIPHEKFSKSTLLNDIMLIKTAIPIKLCPGQATIVKYNLNPSVTPLLGYTLDTPGWGESYYGNPSPNLYYTQFWPQDSNDCLIDNTNIQSGFPFSTCAQMCGISYYYYMKLSPGDLGGPAVNIHRNPEPLLYGIVSRTMLGTQQQYYGVFTWISYYATWMCTAMANN